MPAPPGLSLGLPDADAGPVSFGFHVQPLRVHGPVFDLAVCMSEIDRGYQRPAILPQVEVRALLDTGAERSYVSTKVIDQLGIRHLAVGSYPVGTASKIEYATEHYVDLVLTEGEQQLYVPNLRVGALPLARLAGVDALVGRDLLAHAVFVYHGQKEEFRLVFPSAEGAFPHYTVRLER